MGSTLNGGVVNCGDRVTCKETARHGTIADLYKDHLLVYWADGEYEYVEKLTVQVA